MTGPKVFTDLFNDDGLAVYPIRYDAEITLDALECLRLWEILEHVTQDSTDIYSDTADWAGNMLAALRMLPVAVTDLDVGEPVN